MRKFVGQGLLLFAGVVSIPLAKNTRPAQQLPIPQQHRDPRLDTLRRFFGELGCPAREYASAFLEAADDYDLDWRLLPSISYVESAGGKTGNGTNLFGWDNGRADFASPITGIHTVAYRLTHSELYREKDLDEKLAQYNPDVDYARRVKSIMRQISADQ